MMFSIRYVFDRLVVRGCTPHYRRPLPEIVAFRRQMAQQLREQGIPLPISKKVRVTLIANQHQGGGDLSNLLQGLVQALDGGTLGKENAILENDAQIIGLHAQWAHTERPGKRDGLPIYLDRDPMTNEPPSGDITPNKSESE